MSVNKQNFAKVFNIAQAHDHIYCTIGVYPDSQEAGEFTVAEMVEAAKHPRIVGVGEAGSDYYQCKGDLSWQHQCFIDHIQVANESSLPTIVHTHGTTEDTLRILRECHTNSGVIHCFPEDAAFARATLDLGLYISFSDIVTFKNTPLIWGAAKHVPADRILVEANAPFLAPVPKHGKQNGPSHARYTVEFVANLCGESLETLTQNINDDFYHLFKRVPDGRLNNGQV